MLYLLDASLLITANSSYYPVDSVPEYWDWLLHQASEGRVKVPREIFEEITDGPNNKDVDLLYQWIRQDAVTKALLLDERVDAALIQEVLARGYGPDLTDTDLETIGRDPFLIAYALAAPNDRAIATVEVSKPKRKRQNRKLPDVCAEFQITSCTPFAMNQTLGFRTDWRK